MAAFGGMFQSGTASAATVVYFSGTITTASTDSSTIQTYAAPDRIYIVYTAPVRASTATRDEDLRQAQAAAEQMQDAYLKDQEEQPDEVERPEPAKPDDEASRLRALPVAPVVRPSTPPRIRSPPLR